MKIYQSAWEKGVKTTYYLHMKPRHTAEQSTVRVNKAEKLGKVGFAAAFKKETAPVAFGGITKLQPPLLTPTPANIEPIVAKTGIPSSIQISAPLSAQGGSASGGQRGSPSVFRGEGVRQRCDGEAQTVDPKTLRRSLFVTAANDEILNNECMLMQRKHTNGEPYLSRVVI